MAFQKNHHELTFDNHAGKVVSSFRLRSQDPNWASLAEICSEYA
jgi:hypothetical protein